MRTLMLNICDAAKKIGRENQRALEARAEAERGGRGAEWVPPPRKVTPLRTVISADGTQGQIASYKANQLLPFNSPLERDLLILMEWDYAIDKIEWKPIDIIWWSKQGRRRTLSPHVLVKPADYMLGKPKRAPTLFSIVPGEQLRTHRREWKEAIRQAREQITGMRMRFQLLSDCCVNPLYAANARFILQFRGPQHQAMFSRKRDAIRDHVWEACGNYVGKQFTLGELLAKIPERLGTRTEILRVILAHYASYMIQCNLTKEPFGLHTVSWVCGNGGWGVQSNTDWRQPENDWYR
jgi:hypothetical protein